MAEAQKVVPLRRRVMDTLENLISGLGIQGRTKAASDTFTLKILSPQELEAAYRGDWIARKIIDIPPTDMTREWREWKADGPDITLIEKLERSLQITSKVRFALQRDRLYGGSVLILGMADGTPNVELIPERVKKDDLKYLLALSRYQVSISEIDRDPLSPYFGEPKAYQVSSSSGSVQIHPSRVIRFVDRPVYDGVTSPNDGWGDSLLQSVYDAVHNASATQQNIADLVPEAKIDIVGVPNLMSSVASADERSALLARFALAGLAKGSNNVLLLDKEEQWEQKQINFAQLPELAQMFLQVASAAADIPVTRMLGQSPKGLSATGDMDLQNYYDGLHGAQTNDLQPKLDRLDEILIRSSLGSKPDGLWWDFAPLWQMSEKDKSQVTLQKAQATQIYVNSGMIPTDAMAAAVQSQLVEDGIYPGLEQGLAESTMEIDALTKPEPADPNAETPPTDGQPTPVKDAAPRTLYVSRNVLNAADILSWAKAQGFKTTLPANDLHVTIAFSRTPVDWMAVGEAYGDSKGEITVVPGGARLVEKLGKAIVLLFSCSQLSWRHEDILRAGASWDFDGYEPHISITYDTANVDPATVEPYRGKIVLGPEIFQEVKENWEQDIAEVETA